MEFAQLEHTVSKSFWYFVDITGTEIDVLQETGSSRWQVHFKTNVSSDSFSFIIILYFVEPNVSRFDAKE